MPLARRCKFAEGDRVRQLAGSTQPLRSIRVPNLTARSSACNISSRRASAFARARTMRSCRPFAARRQRGGAATRAACPRTTPWCRPFPAAGGTRTSRPFRRLHQRRNSRRCRAACGSKSKFPQETSFTYRRDACSMAWRRRSSTGGAADEKAGTSVDFTQVV